MPASLLITFFAYPMVSSLAFRAFYCESFDDGARLLAADYRVDCDDADEYAPVRRLAWTATIPCRTMCTGLDLASYRGRLSHPCVHMHSSDHHVRAVSPGV